MYSGSGIWAFGVLGDMGRISSGHSSADLKEMSETAVRGSEESECAELLHTDTTELFGPTDGLEKGLATSLATLITVSNFEASSRVGSR